MKRLIKIGVLLILILSAVIFYSRGNERYVKYQVDFFDLFNTHTLFIGYARNQNEFTKYADIVYKKLSELDRFFDIYNSYEGLNNLKTVNEQAGLAPVAVSDEIIDLLKFSVQAYYDSYETVNAALGPMLSIWHNYREEGISNPTAAELPPLDTLKAAMQSTDIEQIIIDEENKTLFFNQPGMALDVGAVAKGFAARLLAEEIKKQGINSCLLDIGGNVVAIGKPMDNNRERWGVGIQDPSRDIDGVNNVTDTIYINDMSAVTSGDYQRFYTVDSVRYNHIIDPSTLMPASEYLSVTVIHSDSAIADMLSTALFILPYEKGRVLAEEHCAAVIWIMHDQSIKTNEMYNKISKKFGGYSATDASGE